jgi:hypothetical protein
MDAAKALKTLLKEAEIYQTQGLLSEARKKYESAILLINDTPDFQNRDELLEGVQKKSVPSKRSFTGSRKEQSPLKSPGRTRS